MNDLKKLVLGYMQSGESPQEMESENQHVYNRLFRGGDLNMQQPATVKQPFDIKKQNEANIQDTEEIMEESLSIQGNEVELIKKALEKHNGKRKMASDELGISERTLYRKIKEYGLE